MRHFSLIRMLHSPARSPRRRSRRFPGGTRRSSRVTAASSCRSLRRAMRCRPGSSLRTTLRSKSRRAAPDHRPMITRPVTTRKLTSSGVHCRQRIERSSRLLASVERIDPGSPTVVESDGPPHASPAGLPPLSLFRPRAQALLRETAAGVRSPHPPGRETCCEGSAW